MRTRTRPVSRAETTELFARFRAGESLAELGTSSGRLRSTIYGIFRKTGGIPPPVPKRSLRALSLAQREEISRQVVAGASVRWIAEILGRSPSTISRELNRNGGRDAYRAASADQRAWEQAARPKACKLTKNSALAGVVTEKLQQNWSPEQISAWLKAEYPREMNVSPETIYKTLFVQARGALKKELLRHLRHAGSIRLPKRRAKKKAGIVDAVSIRERPAEANDRAVPGHWEGDLIAGYRNGSFIGTLVERTTRYVILVKVPSKDSGLVAEALARAVQQLPRHLWRSLTWDRGLELARHKDFTVATDVKVYFCDPHSPWQRGSNENTNGLLRQYFPKGMPLGKFTQEELDAVADQLNGRPRETLGWRTPAQKLRELVATTV